jgi:hypothetical protein
MASDDGGVGRSDPTPLRANAGAVGGARSPKPAIREARLRPEFADQYAGIQAGVWFSAAGMAERLITRLLREGVSDEELPQRVLDPTHFEFRGGEGAPTRSNSAR